MINIDEYTFPAKQKRALNQYWNKSLYIYEGSNLHNQPEVEGISPEIGRMKFHMITRLEGSQPLSAMTGGNNHGDQGIYDHLICTYMYLTKRLGI